MTAALRLLYRILAGIIALCLLTGATLACQTSGANRVVISAGTSVAVTPAYSAQNSGDQLHAFSVTIQNPHNSKSCSFALSFTRAALPATMANGASTLSYSVESAAGATLLQTTGYVFGSSPPNTNRLAGFVAANSSVTLNVRIRIPAGQTGAAAGSYADSTVTIGIYEISGGTPVGTVDTQPFTVTANVVTACTLPAPDAATLNFTPSITNGVPSSSYVLRSTFTGVSCTQPARIRLTGGALQPSVATPAASGFDNFIDWQATGVFSAATAALDTRSAVSATSAGFNVSSGAVSGATITVDVNLVAGNPVIAGTYSAILIVSIDPNL